MTETHSLKQISGPPQQDNNVLPKLGGDVHIEDAHSKDAMKEVNTQVAQLGSEEEHALSFWQACNTYPMAIFWATIITMTVIMEGYDQGLITNLFAYPSFLRKYGYYDARTHKYTLSASWMAGLGNAAACGSFVGLLFNGYIAEKFGHRRVITGYLTFMAGFIFIVFFAPSIEVLLVGQVLLGVTWGGMAVLGTAYASEVCPMALRGHLTAIVNIAWAVGQFVGSGILTGLVNNKTKWSYKIPFAVQWVWICPLILAAILAPESPWWLIRKGRIEDAQRSLRRLSKLPAEKIDAQVQLMIRTNAIEREMKTGTSYLDCFKGTNLRRTEIASLILAAKTLAGEAFAYSPVYFFVQSGFSASDSYKLNLGSAGLAIVGTIIPLCLLVRFGRRTVLLTGLSLLAIDLLIIGCLATSHSKNVLWAQAAFAIVWLGLYSTFLGPESFCLAAEVSATRLRAPTLSIARNTFVVVNLINRIIEPYLINPTAGDLKGKTAFYWLATCLVTLLWVFFRVPETRGRTYEELDLMFEHRIPAWKFSETNVSELTEAERLAEPE